MGQRTVDSDKVKQVVSVDGMGECKVLPRVALAEFAATEPQIVSLEKRVPQGGEVLFTLDAVYQDVSHFWLFGNYNSDDRQLSRESYLVVKTEKLSIGRYRVRATLTSKQREQKHLQAYFDVIESPGGGSQSSGVLASVDNATISLNKQSQDVQIESQFVGMERAFFSWVVDSFTSQFREVKNGAGESSLGLENLKKGKYRVRLSISYQGRTIRLEEHFDIESGEQGAAETPLLSVDDFIVKTAETFARTRSQDAAHNPLIEYLLSTTYSEKNVGQDNPHKEAYRSVRGNIGKTSHPQYWVRDRQQLDLVKSSDFFIRDFLQLQVSGGESADHPFIVGDNYSTGLIRDGLSIMDGAIDSRFSNDFNWFVDKFNGHESVQNMSHKVAPFKYVAHRDAIQLIPYSRVISQLAGMTMRNVTINGNTIVSMGALQGVFATDGTFQNLHITNNSIQIGGAHVISISGMLSGKIEGNTNLQGDLLSAESTRLYPLRIGGGANIYVMSFHNASGVDVGDPNYYAYEDIEGDQQIDDRRANKDRSNASYWKNVDLPTLQLLFADTYVQVRRELKAANLNIQAMKTASSSEADVHERIDKSRQDIKEIWNSMMLQVGEPDRD